MRLLCGRRLHLLRLQFGHAAPDGSALSTERRGRRRAPREISAAGGAEARRRQGSPPVSRARMTVGPCDLVGATAAIAPPSREDVANKKAARGAEGVRAADARYDALLCSTARRLVLGRQATCMTSCATLTITSPGRIGRSQIPQTVSSVPNTSSPIVRGTDYSTPDVKRQRRHSAQGSNESRITVRGHAAALFVGGDRIVARPRARFHAA